MKRNTVPLYGIIAPAGNVYRVISAGPAEECLIGVNPGTSEQIIALPLSLGRDICDWYEEND